MTWKEGVYCECAGWNAIPYAVWSIPASPLSSVMLSRCSWRRFCTFSKGFHCKHMLLEFVSWGMFLKVLNLHQDWKYTKKSVMRLIKIPDKSRSYHLEKRNDRKWIHLNIHSDSSGWYDFRGFFLSLFSSTVFKYSIAGLHYFIIRKWM